MEKLNCKSQLATKQEKKKEIEVMLKQMKHNTQINKKNGANGITLIALIITIVILIILALITINIAFGDNGLINRAEIGRDMYSNATQEELGVLEKVDDYLEYVDRKNNFENGETAPDTPVDPIIPYTNVYVTLYTNGTLGFSNDESKIDGLMPIEGKNWNITKEQFSAKISGKDYTATTPWFEDRESIIKVVFSNEIVPKSVTAWFCGCTKLTNVENMANLNTSNVSNFSAMFFDCISLLNIDVSTLNTNNVTNMSAMFSVCDDLKYMSLTEIKGLENFNTSNVTDMSNMFWNCANLISLNLNNFNTSNVTDMSYMFGGYNIRYGFTRDNGIRKF